MVLRRAEGDDRAAVGDREEARFLAGHEFLDHHFCPGFAKGPGEHMANGVLGLLGGLGNDHALASSQPVRLDDDGQVEPGERGLRFGTVAGADIARGRDASAITQRLGEALGPFEQRRPGRRAKHRHAGSAQAVRQSIDQRRFGADHDEADGLFGAEGRSRGMIGHIERDACRLFGYPRISGRGEDALNLRGLRQFPAQGMFASTTSHQQDIHARPLFR